MRTANRKPGKLLHAITDPVMTKEKYNELKNKLDKLKKYSQPKAAAEVSRLAELGDFSENTEYQMAKGKLRGINNAILKLDQQINRAQIISSKTQNDTIEIGHQVTVKSKEKTKTYHILGSAETDPSSGVISYLSPIGQSLIGHKVGDKIQLKLADKIVEYEIIKIK